jgi:hypothetical protein
MKQRVALLANESWRRGSRTRDSCRFLRLADCVSDPLKWLRKVEVAPLRFPDFAKSCFIGRMPSGNLQSMTSMARQRFQPDRRIGLSPLTATRPMSTSLQDGLAPLPSRSVRSQGMANFTLLLRTGSNQQGHGELHRLANGQHRFKIGADEKRLELGLFQKRLPNLLTTEEVSERRPVENLLGSIWFHGCGAVKLQGATK